MRSEKEIREKISSLENALKQVNKANISDNNKYGLKEDICGQIDMLLWVLTDKSGFDPLDERIGEILANLEK